MTNYTKRDIRAADMFAMILTGLGALLLVLGVLPLLSDTFGRRGSASPAIWILGGVFVVLGLALNLKIRQLVRNGGREPEDYPGVPE